MPFRCWPGGTSWVHDCHFPLAILERIKCLILAILEVVILDSYLFFNNFFNLLILCITGTPQQDDGSAGLLPAGVGGAPCGASPIGMHSRRR